MRLYAVQEYIYEAVEVAVAKPSRRCSTLMYSDPEQQLSPLVDLTLEGHGLIDVVDTYPIDEMWYSWIH